MKVTNPLLPVYSFLFLVLVVSCNESVKRTDVPSIIYTSTESVNSVFYNDFSKYPTDLGSLPIGVFDSGTGGLTVMERILICDEYNNVTGLPSPDGVPDFRGENFIYLGDHANMPYGNYAAENKSDYLRELIIKDVLFLMGEKYYRADDKLTATGRKEPVKIIVIACNTATAYGLADIEYFLQRTKTDVKVIGVINAGVKATLASLERDENYAIGVLATPGTISSGAYQRTILQMKEDMGFTGEISVVNQAGKGFAESVDGEKDYMDPSLRETRSGYRGPVIGDGEDDIKLSLLDVYNFDRSPSSLLIKGNGNNIEDIQLNSAGNYSRFHLVSLFEKYRTTGNSTPVKSVILGCTHYPYLLDTLNRVIDELRGVKKDGKYLYRELISDDFTFVDPALFTAKECYEALNEKGYLTRKDEENTLFPFISVPAYGLEKDMLNGDGSLKYEIKYGRETGLEEITTVNVPFSRTNIDANVLYNLEKLVPASYDLIRKRMDD